MGGPRDSVGEHGLAVATNELAHGVEGGVGGGLSDLRRAGRGDTFTIQGGDLLRRLRRALLFGGRRGGDGGLGGPGGGSNFC